jgi:acetyl esterase/lipase
MARFALLAVSLSRRIRSVLPVLALGMLAGSVRAGEKAGPGTYELEAISDVPYYQGGDADPVKHKLDLYLPRGAREFPVLFFVHGGAWSHGDKTQLGIYKALGSAFARHGIGTVVINYRLSPKVKHPGHIEDVARAFVWTCGNIARYGGRPDQIFLSGHSAGGHLVSLLVTDDSYVKNLGGSLKPVKGVLPLSGIYDIPERFFPSVFGTDPELHKNASPLRHVRDSLPPFLVICADKDLPGCDREPSELFCKALKARGNEAAVKEIGQSNHYLIILNAAVATSPVFQEMYGFIEMRLGKK